MIIRFLTLTVILLKSHLIYAQDPNAPLITHISVNQNQQVEINWINSSNQVQGYIIYFQDFSGLWIPLDTIQGIANTTYTTSNANPQNKIETYSVVAFDSFGNNSIRSEQHSTMFLTNSYTECDTVVRIDWNSYSNMLGLYDYQLKVFEENNLGNNVLVDSILIDRSDTSYLLRIDYTTNYTIFLEALSSSSFKSNSNIISFETTEIDLPTYSYINRVTVNGKNSFEISVVSDSEDLNHINIYKSYTPTGFQFLLGEAIQESDEYILNDDLVLPERNLYYYRAKPVDICGKEYSLPKFISSVDTSVVSNLKLEALTLNDEQITVKTGSYNFYLDDSQLQIWKSVNDELIFLQDGYSNYQYDFSIRDDYGDVCILAMSIEKNQNSLGLKDTVLSNKVCVSKAPLIFVPKAFTPKNGDPKNETWNIVFYKADAVKSFNLSVYSRWGKEVFSTSDLDQGWNGDTNGVSAPDGIYIYDLQITYSEDQKFRDSGSILLIR